MKTLTDAQRLATTSTDRSTAVVAGAGSGKTTVLIERCLNIIGDDPTALDRLLAITFTEKAAAELKSRLRHKLPSREHHRLTSAWIGTFHGCCARMLRQHAPLLLLDPSFSIIDENAAHLLARQTIKATLLETLQNRDPQAVLLVDELDFRNAANALEDLMAFRWHARMALAQPRSDDKREQELLQATAHIYQLCEGSYLEALATQDALDFQELEILALKFLEEHPNILRTYQSRFRHLLIDEFQDTNDVQTKLAMTLYAPGTNHLCIVGDPRQSIYRFRGANVDCFETALKEIRRTDGNVIPLVHNFRSRRRIIEFINLFGTHPRDEILTTKAEGLIAARPDDHDGPAIVSLSIEDAATAAERRHREAHAIAAYISELTSTSKYGFGDIVCLFQALTNVGEYEASFKAHSIPFRFYGGRGLLDRQEVCDLMHALRYAANPGDDIALLGLLRSPLIGISDDECVRLAGAEGNKLRARARKHASCDLLHKLETLAPHRRPSEVLRFTIDETGFEWILSQLDASGGMQASVDRLVSLAESLERQAPTTLEHFISFIAHLRERNARLGDPPAAGVSRDAVQCMTVHTAKGLEFPVVILPDLIRQERTTSAAWIFHREEGIAFKFRDSLHPFGKRLPTERYEALSSIEKNQSEAEHARLLYVAMTRARDLLILPFHRSKKIKGRWHGWLKDLPCDQTIERSNHRTIAQPNDRTIERPIYRTMARSNDVTIERSYSVSQLEAFERCPQEYYLKYVLGVPAAQLLTPSGEKLAANVRGSIVHGVLEKLTPDNISAFDDIVRDECIANDVYPDDVMIDAIAKPVRAFVETPLFSKAAEGCREVRFDWLFGDQVITGYIDWYIETSRGLEIIDFKTDDVDEAGTKGRAIEYDLQMSTYALALEAARGTKVHATTLAFLAPNVLHSCPFDAQRRSEGLQRIRIVMNRITNEDFSIQSIKPPCYKCPYHHNGLCWKDMLVDHG